MQQDKVALKFWKAEGVLHYTCVDTGALRCAALRCAALHCAVLCRDVPPCAYGAAMFLRRMPLLLLLPPVLLCRQPCLLTRTRPVELLHSTPRPRSAVQAPRNSLACRALV